MRHLSLPMEQRRVSTSSTPAPRRHRRAARTCVRRHKDGRLIDVSVSVAPMYDEAGRLVGISSDHQRHRRAQGARAAHRVPDARAVAPLQEPAGGGAGDRRPDGAPQPQRRGVPDALLAAHLPPWRAARICWWRATGQARAWPTWCARSWRRSPRDSSSRIEVKGPRLELKPDAVHSITLALHELATNAAKYGALSVPDGRVAIDWDVGALTTADARFRMSWRESDGPPVAPPVSKGFGHVVIAEMVGELAARPRHARLRAARACCGPSTRRDRACWSRREMRYRP